MKTDTEKHENLCKFLALDPSNPVEIYIKKLKQAMEEFETNEELRGRAQRYIQNYVEYDEEQKENNDDVLDEEIIIPYFP